MKPERWQFNNTITGLTKTRIKTCRIKEQFPPAPYVATIKNIKNREPTDLSCQ